MARPNSKNVILDAAEAIVIESGAAHMTLNAVAKRSGISKGGLLYNFSTKEALLEGMIGRMAERLDRFRDKIRNSLPEGGSNELMVEILVIKEESESSSRLSAGLLAAVASNPDLTRKMREKLRSRFNAELTSGSDFTRSSILFFAVMGLHFHDLLNLSLLDTRQKDKIQKELVRLAGCDDPI